VTVAYAPHSLDEALAIKREHPEATPVAGGTDLMVEINARRLRPEALLDLSRVDELREWSRSNGTVFVGAGVTFARIARELTEFRALAEAARSVGSRQIRNRATIGGNLATASPAGDSIPVLAAYGADVLVAADGRSTLRIPWQRFFTGPKRTTLADDELVVGVEWRWVSGPGSFAKVGIRNAMTISIAGVCVQLDEAEHAARIALGSVGPTVLRAPRVEAFAASLDWEAPGKGELGELGRLSAMEASPIDDLRGSAEYRRHTVEVLVPRAFGWALEDRC